MKSNYLLNVLFFILYNVYAQDILSIRKLDSLFIQNNFQLLAKKYNIDAQKALIRQAQLLDNPNVYIEQNIYNTNNKKYFDVSKQGEYVFQIQQLIKTAGKRNKQIQLAHLNYQISQYEFDNLVSNLLYQMHTIYFQYYALNKIKNSLNTEIADIYPLINLYESQYQKGNISLKEVFRLRALLFNVQSIQNDITLQMNDLKKDLSVFTGIEIKDNNVLQLEEINTADSLTINVWGLVDTALKYRPDYLLLKKNYEYNKLFHSFQKSLAVPDMRLGYGFDKAGNFIMNYNALSLSFELPVFNRNQGNIQMASFLIKEAESELKQKEREIKQEIFTNYEKLIAVRKLYFNIQQDFLKNFDNIKDGMSENFKKRNISLLEYADFFDSYINSVQQYYSLVNKYYNQIETFNYVVGKRIIK